MSQEFYKLSPTELETRKEIIILSDQGLKFRDEIKEQQQMMKFHLPKIIKTNLQPTPEESLINQSTRRAQLSLQGIKSKPKLIQELTKDLQVERPYIITKLDQMTTKMLKQDKPITHITHRIYDLYQQLDRNTRILEKRKVHFQRNILENPLNHSKEQASQIEDLEFQDKQAQFAAMEQKVMRIQQNYDLSLRRRQETMKQVQANLRTKSLIDEQEYINAPDKIDRISTIPLRSVINKEIQEYRKQQRLKDYQKCKYGKHWDKQPPPQYTSKQAQLEADQKDRLLRLQEQQEYELELQRRNS